MQNLLDIFKIGRDMANERFQVCYSYSGLVHTVMNQDQILMVLMGEEPIDREF